MSWKSEFLENIRSRRILVIGDLMLDKYLWGRVERISPEAPVPVLNLESSLNRLGGAANVALNLVSLGAGASLIGVIGNDPNGDILESLLDESGIEHNSIIRLPEIPTTTKTRVIAGHQHVLRVDDEKILDLSDSTESLLLQKVESAIVDGKPDAIILQDYNKGVLTPRVITEVIRIATSEGVPVAVDPKLDNFEAFSGASIFKPNLRELSGQFVEPVTAELGSLDKAVTALRKKMSIKQCSVTLSEHGIYISTQEGSGIYPTSSRDVVDVCGAGDAVISVLTLAYLEGFTPEKAAEIANKAGGAVCGIVGVAPVTSAMLGNELGVETFL